MSDCTKSHVLQTDRIGQSFDVGIIFPASQIHKREFHVRLSAADPDFTDHHIVQHDTVGATECQRVRPSGHSGEKFYYPVPLHISQDRIFLVVPSGKYSHLLTGISPAPEIHPGILLKDHVVGKNGREFDGRRKAIRKNEKKK